MPCIGALASGPLEPRQAALPTRSLAAHRPLARTGTASDVAGTRWAARTAAVVALALALGAIALPAQAKPRRIGAFGDWSAWLIEDDGKKECFIHSRPKKSEGDYTRRGKVSVSVTHRPADRVESEFSFRAGYTMKPESRPRVVIDGEAFRLFAHEDAAFAPDAATDARMVGAMKRGRRMIVHGVSSRGTRTRDTYSLSGFTAAHRAIDRACGKR